MTMRRSDVLTLAAATLATAAIPLSARAAAPPIRAALGVTDSTILIPVAQQFGYLERVGLTVETQIITNGPATIAAILGGSVDAGASNSLSFLQARDKGLPVKIIAAQAIYRAGQASTALVVNKASGARSGKDLNGKVVAVNGLGGSPHIAVQMWIDKNGGDSKSVHYIEMPFPSMPAALTANRVDAAIIAEPGLSEALADGRVLGDAYGALGPLWLSDAIIATESWIDAHADDVKRFAQALRAAGTYANHNRDKTAEISAKMLKIDPAVVRVMKRAIFAERTTPGMLQPVIDAGVAYGALTKPLVAADMFSRNAMS